MFRRLVTTESMNELTLLAFVIFLLVFFAIVLWALCLPRERVRHLSNLPLEEEPTDRPDLDEHQS